MFVVTDANMTEDPIDRESGRKDCAAAVRSLTDFKDVFDLTDGWRKTYPVKKEFTYHSTNSRKWSRIDRIYVKADLFNRCRAWEIQESGINTDHKEVLVDYTDPDTPHIGRGRWTIPNALLYNERFLESVEKTGNAAIREIARISRAKERTTECNAQVVWKKLKGSWLENAAEEARNSQRRKDAAKRSLKADLVHTLNDNRTNDEERLKKANEIQSKLEKLLRSEMEDQQIIAAARYKSYEETNSKQ